MLTNRTETVTIVTAFICLATRRQIEHVIGDIHVGAVRVGARRVPWTPISCARNLPVFFAHVPEAEGTIIPELPACRETSDHIRSMSDEGEQVTARPTAILDA